MNDIVTFETAHRLKKGAELSKTAALKALLAEWLQFSFDVQPRDAAEQERLDGLKKKTFAALDEQPYF